jgi:hypothetical protein
VSDEVAPFAVREGSWADAPAVLQVLADGYGRPFGEEWLRWKHLDSPFGPSRWWLAEDDEGVLGVAFAMPWPMTADGVAVAGHRTVDGATSQRAHRRGVFMAVVRTMVDHCAGGVALATATPAAQRAHIKNGAAALAPIRTAYAPARWRRAALHDDVDTNSMGHPADPQLRSVWTDDALSWRLDERSGWRYETFRLASADQPNGAVVRVVRAGAGRRTLVVSSLWGSPRERATLVGAVARRNRCPVVATHAGPGTPQPWPRVAMSRGETLMCVWDQRTMPDDRSSDLAGWALDGLDLEGAI